MYLDVDVERRVRHEVIKSYQLGYIADKGIRKEES